MATMQQRKGVTSPRLPANVVRLFAILFGTFLAGHGLVHVMGFIAQWKIATIEGLEYRTTILDGHIDLGSIGIRIEGLFWLLPVVGFVAGALGLVLGRIWWKRVVLVTTLMSLVICVAGWPQAQVGVYVNIGILAVLGVVYAMHARSAS